MGPSVSQQICPAPQQESPQHVWPEAHAPASVHGVGLHEPSQIVPAPHLVPHAPQWSGLLNGLMHAPLQQMRAVPHAASHPPPLPLPEDPPPDEAPLLEALPPELVLPELLPLPELEPLLLDDDEEPLASSPEPEASSPPEPVVDPPQWEANARAEKAARARDHEDRRVIEFSPRRSHPGTPCHARDRRARQTSATAAARQVRRRPALIVLSSLGRRTGMQERSRAMPDEQRLLDRQRELLLGPCAAELLVRHRLLHFRFAVRPWQQDAQCPGGYCVTGACSSTIGTCQTGGA